MRDEEEAVAIESGPQGVPASDMAGSANVVPHPLPEPLADRLSAFHPPAYRGVVAGWPVPWRERWGRRANALEETGLSWRDAEAQAFVEVWSTFRQGHLVLPLVSSDPERN
jgi:hypothetical protein